MNMSFVFGWVFQQDTYSWYQLKHAWIYVSSKLFTAFCNKIPTFKQRPVLWRNPFTSPPLHSGLHCWGKCMWLRKSATKWPDEWLSEDWVVGWGVKRQFGRFVTKKSYHCTVAFIKSEVQAKRNLFLQLENHFWNWIVHRFHHWIACCTLQSGNYRCNKLLWYKFKLIKFNWLHVKSICS